jgi:hypothetical protein
MTSGALLTSKMGCVDRAKRTIITLNSIVNDESVQTNVDNSIKALLKPTDGLINRTTGVEGMNYNILIESVGRLIDSGDALNHCCKSIRKIRDEIQKMVNHMEQH